MRILTYLVMFYMSLALIWWTILLTKNNRALYEAKISAMEETSPKYKEEVAELKSFHERKARMILGEGFVFGCMLIIGLYLIQRLFNKELENVQRQKNFLLSITHELKTPIASVNLITETLQKRDLDKAKRDELLEATLEETHRLEKLINNLLFSARLQSRYVYTPESIVLKPLFQEHAGRLSRLHPKATIQIDCPETLTLEADRESLHSLVSNLMENGIKYGGEHPKVTVRAYLKKPFIFLAFEDEGSGIHRQEIQKIFDPFYRVGNEETRQSKGTGLGLYITKKIVVDQGGQIEVDNKTSGGSIFTIKFPMGKNQPV